MVERLPSSGLSPTQPVRPALAPERTADPRLDALQRALATVLGSKVPVAVLSRLGDGSFLVKVADTPVRMALPAGTQPGTELSMKVLAAAPQPTFQLGDATLHGAPVPLGAQASALAASVAAAMATANTPLPHAGGHNDAADLSPAARLLAQVLQSAAGSEAGGANVRDTAALKGTAPLLPQGAPDPAQLAGRLEQALAKSGLFYESHVGEWAEGKRPLSELMQEPQARNAPGASATDPANARMINLQLASHEHSQVAWQGQLAPGQPFEWKVAREQDGHAGRDGGQEAAWQSGLRLRFAALGEIEAHVSLRGSQVRIELQAAPEALASLRAGAPRLQDALAAAGSELAALRIHGREDA